MDALVLLVLLPGFFDSVPNECDTNQTIREVRRSYSNKQLPEGKGDWSSVCEGYTLSLECPFGSEIRIHDAQYGRNDTTTCGTYDHPISCYAKSSFGIVHKRCNGKRKCLIDAENYEFGDPCRGYNKLLRAKYSCEPVRGEWLKSETVCESDEKQISCPFGSVIVVKDAFYGRNDTRPCMRSMAIVNTKCSSDKAFGIINERCHLKSKCTLGAHNALFGDPCPWTYKYLQVEYGCSAVSDKARRSVTIPHNHKHKISCQNGQKIMIANAWYIGSIAAADRDICENTLESVQNDKKECTSAVDHIKKRCNKAEECVLFAQNACADSKTEEDLEIEYDCVEDITDYHRVRRSSEQKFEKDPEPREVSVCEHEAKRISCAEGEVMTILEAEYGRRDNTTCVGPMIANLHCGAGNSKQIVTAACNGKLECDLVSTDKVFGDPCPGTYKYLRVKYSCKPGQNDVKQEDYPKKKTTLYETGPREVSVCEHEAKRISCAEGEVLTILEAEYGRRDNTTCVDPRIANLHCGAGNSKQIVTDACNGKQACTLMSKNEVFGDPCVGTYKYLRVKYNCKAGQNDVKQEDYPKKNTTLYETGPREVSVCEHEAKRISCAEGEVLTILEAEYGRRDNTTCVDPRIANLHCGAGNSKQIVTDACNGKQACTLMSKNEVFGDPCVGTYKYLRVKYNCKAGQTDVKQEDYPKKNTTLYETGPREVSVCEHEAKRISCAEGEVLTILEAEYGRRDNTTCVDPRIANLHCGAGNSKQIVTDACNGKQACTLMSKNEVFGDPCVGTYKYLRVKYNCKADNGKVAVDDESLSVVICEGGTTRLTCPGDDVLNVTRAFYGRKDSSICPGVKTNITTCDVVDALPLLVDRCNGRHFCKIESNNGLFEDPCIGTTKYLDLRYKCEPGTPDSNDFTDSEWGTVHEKRVAENNKKTLSCPTGSHIHVLNGTYGNGECTTKDSFMIVASLCEGKYECLLESSNTVYGNSCAGNFNYLHVKYTCAISREVLGMTTVVICENYTKTISCPENSEIVIKNASYGRSSSDVCPGKNSHITSCSAGIASPFVKDRCNGKQSCVLQATNQVFDDPCSGTYKYLEVEYKCKEGGQVGDPIKRKTRDVHLAMIEENVCETHSKIISCPVGAMINIIEAEYGRRDNTTCVHTKMADLACGADDSKSILCAACDGKHMCELKSDNTVFGDPCVGTYKYLNVKYSCTPVEYSGLESNSAFICESESKTISCPNNKVINIKKASYGRSITSICPGAKTHVTDCRADEAHQVITERCNGKQYCILESNNYIFGDPCVGTTKYLEVEFDCHSEVPISMGGVLDGNALIEESILEHKSGILRCPKGSFIQILTANYGSKNCTAESTFRIVSSQCNQKETCLLFSKDEVFGDPCRGTLKYLTVKYQCKPVSATVRHVGVADENRSLKLVCPTGSSISVFDAFYGVTVTRDNSYYKECGSNNSFTIVSEMCNLKENCVVPVTNDIFKSICIGKLKKLKVKYDCVVVTKYSYAIIPERQSSTISCPAGTSIRISDAAYGIVYGTGQNLLASTRCSSSDAQDIVSGSCDHLENCELSSSNDWFGDPCFGIQKDLVVEYHCTKGETNRVYACENSVLSMQCPPRTTISIISAHYGRNHPYICNIGSRPIYSHGCHCVNSTSSVYKLCQGKSYCAVAASNDLFGDPCSDVQKYLEVEYACADEISEATASEYIPENSLRNITFYLENVDEEGCTDFAAQIKKFGEDIWRTEVEENDFRLPQTITGLEPDTSYEVRVIPRSEMTTDLYCQPSVTVHTWSWIDVK